MARDGHELPKVLPRPAMPHPSMPCRQATHEKALQPFQGWPACRARGLQVSSTLLDTPHCTPILRNVMVTTSAKMQRGPITVV
jgi:hypothetical protein